MSIKFNILSINMKIVYAEAQRPGLAEGWWICSSSRLGNYRLD